MHHTADHDDARRLLQDSARRFIREQHDFERRRSWLRDNAGLHPALWQRFAELGWLAVPFSEEHGGLAGSHADLVVLAQAFGEGLVVEPWRVNLLCGRLLALCGDDAQRERLLIPMMEGQHQLALCHEEPGRRFGTAPIATRAIPAGDGFQLEGDKAVVPNGDRAESLLVSAWADDRLALFVVPADAPGVTRTPYATVDGMSAADIQFTGVMVPASARLGDDDAREALEIAQDTALLLLCAEAVGIMDSLVADTLAYCKAREQFGAPIGRFQVLQHRMVDMFIQTEQARALLDMAVSQADGPDAREARRAVSALKVWLGSAARFVGQQAVQLHGGMGVTDELRIGHGFKRLTLIEQSLGNETYHLRRLDRLSPAA